jgi:hypothetical protein
LSAGAPRPAAILWAFNPKVQAKSIDLTQTVTNAFVQKATPRS